jgi:hypothetical protein
MGEEFPEEVTPEMIAAGAEILLASPFCEFSQGIAQDYAEEILRAAANLARKRKQTAQSRLP